MFGVVFPGRRPLSRPCLGLSRFCGQVGAFKVRRSAREIELGALPGGAYFKLCGGTGAG